MTNPAPAEDLRAQLIEAAAKWVLMYPLANWGPFRDLVDGDAVKALAMNWGRDLTDSMLAVFADHNATAVVRVDEVLDTFRQRAEQAEAERDAMAALMERMPDTHARFSVVGSDEPPRCADWCDVCRRERLQSALAEAQHATGMAIAKYSAAKERAERAEAERDAARLIVEELQALRDTLYGRLDSAVAERDALKDAAQAALDTPNTRRTVRMLRVALGVES